MLNNYVFYNYNVSISFDWEQTVEDFQQIYQRIHPQRNKGRLRAEGHGHALYMDSRLVDGLSGAQARYRRNS